MTKHKPQDTVTQGAVSSLNDVIEVAAMVLQTSALAPTSDFFEVGGNSLAAIQIVAKLHDRFGVSITLTDFFDAPDLRAVADLIDERLTERRSL